MTECRGSEDLLTASVFERLGYLSKQTLNLFFYEVFKKSSLGDKIVDLGCLDEIEFWPEWYLSDRRRVEPDCFLKFENLNLIVEAKRWDVQQQDFGQWDRELTAYWRLSTKKKVIFFAVGGLDESHLKDVQALKTEFCDKYPLIDRNAFLLIAISWSSLWKIIKQFEVTSIPPEQRVIRDICNAIEFHNIRVADPAWLSDLPKRIEDNDYLIHIESSKFFRQLSAVNDSNWNAICRSGLLIDERAIEYFTKDKEYRDG